MSAVVFVVQTAACGSAPPRAPIAVPVAHESDIFGPMPTASKSYVPEWYELPRVTITAPSPSCVSAEEALLDRESTWRWRLFTPESLRNLNQMPGDHRIASPPSYPTQTETDAPIYTRNAYDVADQSESVAAALEQAMEEGACSVDAPVHVKVGFLEGRSLPSATLVLAGKAPPCLEAALSRLCASPGSADLSVHHGRVVERWHDPAGPLPFNWRAAADALAAVDLATCKIANGSERVGFVWVTFKRRGVVDSVELFSRDLAGTTIGACVSAKFRRVHVPAFSDRPVTVGTFFGL